MPGDASRFQSLFGLELAPYNEHFTFKQIENPPEFCISGQSYLGAMATKTYAGKPWQIFDANNFVYNFATGRVVLKSAINSFFDLSQAGNYFVSNGLILPGSLTKTGEKVNSYFCHFSFDTLRFRYSEVSFD
jgi:hypothetical protein